MRHESPCRIHGCAPSFTDQIFFKFTFFRKLKFVGVDTSPMGSTPKTRSAGSGTECV